MGGEGSAGDGGEVVVLFLRCSWSCAEYGAWCSGFGGVGGYCAGELAQACHGRPLEFHGCGCCLAGRQQVRDDVYQKTMVLRQTGLPIINLAV